MLTLFRQITESVITESVNNNYIIFVFSYELQPIRIRIPLRITSLFDFVSHYEFQPPEIRVIYF